MSDACAAVVSADVELGEVTEMGHGAYAVGCHGLFAVEGVRWAGGGSGGFAVAAEVEEDEGVVRKEEGGDMVPD